MVCKRKEKAVFIVCMPDRKQKYQNSSEQKEQKSLKYDFRTIRKELCPGMQATHSPEVSG
jgi:hypothetical protein